MTTTPTTTELDLTRYTRDLLTFARSVQTVAASAGITFHDALNAAEVFDQVDTDRDDEGGCPVCEALSRDSMSRFFDAATRFRRDRDDD